MKTSIAILLTILAAALPRDARAQGAGGASTLRVGAAKVDVTPSERELSKNSFGILDHLYSRAIVLERGGARAALITVDAGGIPDALWQTVSQRVDSELKIPVANVLLTATHTHSAG